MLKDRETELALIGLAIIDQTCAEKLIELPSDAFGYPETATIVKHIENILKEHLKPDFVTVAGRIPREDTATVSALFEAQNLGYSPAMFEQYAIQCMSMRKRRLLKQECIKIANRIDDPGEDVEEMSMALQKIITDNGSKPESISMRDALMKWFDHIGSKPQSISTGIAGLDKFTGGFSPGNLIVLGARPGVGKSALAISIVRSVADKCGPVLVISLEMTEIENIERLVSAEAQIPMDKFKRRDLTEEESLRHLEACEVLDKLPIKFSETANTPLKIKREASAMLRECGLKLIVVDYLQLMRADMKTGSRYEEVTEISRELKQLAMSLKIPILALTQFNRASEAGGTQREPSMAEARESGAIEQDANIFLILHSPPEPKMGTPHHEMWAYCKDKGTDFMTLRIAKNRQGQTGLVPLEFNKPEMSFITLEKGS